MLSKMEWKVSTRITWKLQKLLRKIPCPPRKWLNKRKRQNNSGKKFWKNSKSFYKLSQIYRNQKKRQKIFAILLIITYHDYHILCVIFVAFLQLWFIHLIISCHPFCKFEALLTGSLDQTTNLESTDPELKSQNLLFVLIQISSFCSFIWDSNNPFMGSEPPKFRGSPNIFLTKYQPPVFLCLLFAEKIDFLLVNQQKISQFWGVEKKIKDC